MKGMHMKTIKIIRYCVTASKSNKSKWIVTSVALGNDGKEFNTGRVHGVGSKKSMNELKNQLQHELSIQDQGGVNQGKLTKYR
jgi:galactitol-specific phosphotransferase system IIB component